MLGAVTISSVQNLQEEPKRGNALYYKTFTMFGVCINKKASEVILRGFFIVSLSALAFWG